MTSKLSDNGLIHAEDAFYLLGGSEPIKFLDATYALPQAGHTPFDAFLNRHIKGAQFFDIDVVADQSAALPHTLPSPEYFAQCVSMLGISNNDHVVIYDQSLMYMASSRAWWMFRTFGHENVYVMQGGLQSWIGQGFGYESGAVESPAQENFISRYRPELVISRDDLLKNIDTKSVKVLDARPSARFKGEAPEPRTGMRAGHIPDSLNLPFGMMLDSHTHHFKEDGDIINNLQAIGINAHEQLAASCGSGVTACTLALAIYKAHKQDVAVYDGSWAEWGDENSGTPVSLS